MNKIRYLEKYFRRVKYNSFESMLEDFIRIYNTYVVYHKNENFKELDLNFNLKIFRFVDESLINFISHKFSDKLYHSSYINHIIDLVKYKKDIENFYNKYLFKTSYLFKFKNKYNHFGVDYGNDYSIIISISLDSDIIFNYLLSYYKKNDLDYLLFIFIGDLSYSILNQDLKFLTFKFQFYTLYKTKTLFGLFNNNTFNLIDNNLSVDNKIIINQLFEEYKSFYLIHNILENF